MPSLINFTACVAANLRAKFVDSRYCEASYDQMDIWGTLAKTYSDARAWKITFGTIAALYLLKRARQYGRRQHNILQILPLKPAPTDVFPQYFANKQGLWLYTREWHVPQPKGVVRDCGFVQ